MQRNIVNTNRTYALLSPAPISPDGKAGSATNALKDGLRASSLYLLNGESQADLDNLRDSLEAEFKPRSAFQHLLFQQLLGWQIRYLRA